LSIGVASLGFGSFFDQEVIIHRLEFIAPALGQLLGTNIAEVIRARGPVTVLALVGLIWSASTFFFILGSSLNEIWGIERSRAVWKRRGLAILFVLVIVGPLLFLASVTNSMIANIFTWLPEQFIQFGRSVSFVIAILLDVAMFMAVYVLLPHANAGWRDVFPGAVAAGLLWETAKKAFLFFISSYLSVSNLVYGSVAAIIAILTWSYLSGLIFLFGAYLNASHYRRKLQMQTMDGQKQ
jgi:membrane protein